jgi:RNA polymerase sigma-70 factor (ECF subfamily)
MMQNHPRTSSAVFSTGGPEQPAAHRPDPPRPEDRQEHARQALVRRAIAGDGEAMHDLLADVHPVLMSICFRMARDPQEAADLCQDALVRIIQGLPGFGFRSKVLTWMVRVTMNVCLSDRRQGRRRATASLDHPPPSGGSGRPRDSGSGALPDGGEPPPPQRIEQKEAIESLSRALTHLEPMQRAILILRDCRGLDYAEIADVLAIPVGTVKSRIFRARAALRGRIEQSEQAPSRPGRSQ